MKIWVDDVRPAPKGYCLCTSVDEFKDIVELVEGIQDAYWCPTKKTKAKKIIELIDLDHDAGDYACDGGDYINILNWLEETGRNYPIRIHNMNPVGVENMRRIIERNGWREVR